MIVCGFVALRQRAGEGSEHSEESEVRDQSLAGWRVAQHGVRLPELYWPAQQRGKPHSNGVVGLGVNWEQQMELVSIEGI
jgi:hypothetical protein